ncbi:monovalent cation/H+ antiporter subunit D [Methylobacterium isbiliense]|uniref:Na(+)/H(+) antiporter subunit D n=1 Tax=Methylobacterium isbiliense TaxID=315478 RepID=A0ABQ4S4T1_9HYPH|nr:monovalent cation/H+ antiporter subunit D [Methylobacterium isbiliense]MDN3624831.1 monovalent cation/H+ antiporter subunit D [Methylobacterium isbiliense]GJD98136.1 Na(+)/H(+) antiporter subunit D [Methylobacterium isbiliense]
MSLPADHLIVAPVVLPLAVSGALLLLDERRHALKAGVSVATALALLAIAVWLLLAAAAAPGALAYRLGDWPAPYGIVLVVDRLSAGMLVLASVLGLCALVYALSRWNRAGPRFHALFLLLLMGVNGAFLTGDLFNLFVFFEVMLAASYGLVLHGSGAARIRAGLAYIAVNLVASLFFLIGVSLVYANTGTLSMADLARRLPLLGPAERSLFEVGAAFLGVTFLIKSSLWPLGFWLPPAYAAASAPAAAILSILSKVGVYVVVRLSLLLFGAESGASAGFGAQWLLAGGIATLAFGTFGLLAARDLARAAGFAVMISSGTVLAALGSGSAAAVSGALFYLAGSTLAAATLFLLAEILQRGRDPAASATEAVFDDEDLDPFEDDDTVVALDIPAIVALLGAAYLVCALMLAGLPPLAGFIGKLAILSGLAGAAAPAGPVAASSWLLVGALLLSGLGTLIPLLRFGIFNFWVPLEGPSPALRTAEAAALAGLVAGCLALSLWGGPALAYAEATARWLASPAGYVDAVLRETAR